MRITAISSAFLILLAANRSQAQQPTEGWSRSEKLKFEVREGVDEMKEVWVIPGGETKLAAKLADTPGWGNLRVHISPSDKIIALQDGGGSLGTNLRVFRNIGGKFTEDDFTRPGDVLERWALRMAGGKREVILGHRYIKLHGWSVSGEKALISISGREGKLQIPGWFAIFDFKTLELSFDLNELNT